MQTTDQLLKKWAPVLESTDAPALKDSHKRRTIAQLLENQEQENIRGRESMSIMEADAPNTQLQNYPDAGTGIAKYDPVLISLVRRAVPQLMAYDVCGVQPLTQPTGLIFAMRSKYTNQAGQEALFNEADSDFSGTGTHAGTNPAVLNRATPGAYSYGTAMPTQTGERLGSVGGNAFSEMSFTIEKIVVEAKTRALKTSYSQELAQDLRALHGLDADAELSQILSTELAAETNREIVRTIYVAAVPGAPAGAVATAGTFDLDVDSNGRWSVEKFKGLMFQIERDANSIAQTTRRGKANFMICSSDVASALQMAGMLDYAPAIQQNLDVDEANRTFVGVLNGKIRVYVDPFSANGSDAEQFYVLGYKGSNAYDAGIYYAPYVPAQFVRTVDPDTFQPRMSIKSRYGIKHNPFSTGTSVADGLAPNSNIYFRRVAIKNLM